MRGDQRKALDLYVAELERLGYAASSVATLTRTPSALFQMFARRPLLKLARTDVEAFLAVRSKTLAPTTHASELARLRTFFRVLTNAERISRDPTEGMTITKKEPSPRLLLGEASVEALLASALVVPLRRMAPARSAALALRDRALLELLYGLGLRASEARAAMVVDLRLADGSLLVRRAKRGKPRVLPLPKRALPHLERYLREGRPVLVSGRDEGKLILTKSGKALGKTTVGEIVAAVARRAGLRAHPHAFRRAVATGLAREGASVVTIRDVLGHQRLSSTAVYVEVEIEDLREAVGRLG